MSEHEGQAGGHSLSSCDVRRAHQPNVLTHLPGNVALFQSLGRAIDEAALTDRMITADGKKSFSSESSDENLTNLFLIEKNHDGTRDDRWNGRWALKFASHRSPFLSWYMREKHG
jgi:hypothetical protein